ncbi:MAG: Flagellar protein FlgJ [peptidoglycan hydrolase] [Pseudolabrys sp.]|jgi:Rod binding domain-containing protein|nr:Flagellar protein FlgJ [peptidoglycan hydrolase] [Pseudolabrys sp.]
MASTAPVSMPVMSAGDAMAMIGTKLPNVKGAMTDAKARAAGQDFEAVFLNSMFQSMFTDTDGDGPMGGNGATGIWRSFLTDEYARTFAKAGGVGIGDEVYRMLIAKQGAQS